MDQYLYSYLILHRQLALPQVGSFTMQAEPARFDQAAGLLYAPRHEIRFSDTAEPKSEKRFFHFLAARTGGDEVAAIQQFHEYMQRLRAGLSEGKEVSIAGMGILRKEAGGEIVFHAKHDSTNLMPPVAVAARAAETETEVTETVTTDDKWWVYALILAGLGAAALVFYYYY